jgi:hypothetical protein
MHMLSKRFIFAMPLLFALTTSPTASATVILTSDAMFGADSVIRDVDNGREFLRLSETISFSYDGVVAALGTTFAGWQVAVESDLLALGAAAGISHGSTLAAEVAMAETLRDWFCPVGHANGNCVRLSGSHEIVRGLLNSMNSNSPFLDAFSIGRRFNVSPEEVDLRISGFGGSSATNEQVWLVRRAAVPEPSILGLLGAGLLGLFVRRRRAGLRI